MPAVPKPVKLVEVRRPVPATASPRSLMFSVSEPAPPSIVSAPRSPPRVPRFVEASEETSTVSFPPPVEIVVCVAVLFTANSVPPEPSATEMSSCALYETPLPPRPRPVIELFVRVPLLPVELESPVSSR